MKKVIGILCIMGLLFGLTGVAMASETDWTIFLRASSDAYGFAAAACKMGTATGKLDAKDTTDGKYNPNQGNQAQAVIYQPTWPDVPAYYVTDQRAPMVAGDVKVWDLLVFAGTSYTQEKIRIGLWGSSLNPTVDAIGGFPARYTLIMVHDPTETYVAGTTWTFAPGSLGTSTAPAVFFDLGNVSALKMPDAQAATQGVQLQLIAESVIPEPGSLLALGSGLVGLIGFAIRRRR